MLRSRGISWEVLLVVALSFGLQGWTPGRLREAGPPRSPAALPELPVLVYHRIWDEPHPGDGGRVLSLDAFERQLRYLRRHGYTALHFREVLEIREGARPCPPRPVVLTFDDGYDDNFSEALPLLRRHGMKGVFFPVVGSIGRAGHITWKKFGLVDPEEVEVGSHGMQHRSMRGRDPAELEAGLRQSRRVLEEFFRVPVVALAFPYGFHDDAAVAAAARAGFRVACTTRPGRQRIDGDLLRTRRYTVLRRTSLDRFARWVGGPEPDDEDRAPLRWPLVLRSEP